MKKILIITFVFALLTSCGSNTDKTKKTSVKNTVTSQELSVEEKEFAESLIRIGSMEQIVLMKTLSSLPHFNRDTLEKLDSIVEISCTQASELCSFSSKE